MAVDDLFFLICMFMLLLVGLYLIFGNVDLTIRRREKDSNSVTVGSSHSNQLNEDPNLVIAYHKADNGKVLIIRTPKKSQNFGGTEYEGRMYIVREDEKLSDAISKFILLSGVE